MKSKLGVVTQMFKLSHPDAVASERGILQQRRLREKLELYSQSCINLPKPIQEAARKHFHAPGTWQT
jgi:hypothetical protein